MAAIAEAHGGGRVEVESPPGGDTTFRLTLPIGGVRPEPEVAEAPHPTSER